MPCRNAFALYLTHFHDVLSPNRNEGQVLHFFCSRLYPRSKVYNDAPDWIPKAKHTSPDSLSQSRKPIKIGTNMNMRGLAGMMADKASLIRNILIRELQGHNGFCGPAGQQYKAFRKYLNQNVTPAEFADILAETLIHGIFAAHIQDIASNRPEGWNIPEFSNKLFPGNIADFNTEISEILNDLTNLFQNPDITGLMKKFNTTPGQEDPFPRFHEDFLAAYNPSRRETRGVWYTPEPVIDFMVRSIDQILRSEFRLIDGLADSSRITIESNIGKNDTKGQPIIQKNRIHRVQILDPATGTGGFPDKIIDLIALKKRHVIRDGWSDYIKQDLIPRLHGFEVMMPSHALCHMKLNMKLREEGYHTGPDAPPLSIHLTNSLETGGRDIIHDLFTGQWSDQETFETRKINTIRTENPILCVMGNPPWSGESANKGQWASELIAPYRMEPGGKTGLKEKNYRWINDDYVKFIRLAEQMITKTGSGILGFVTNHGYIDNPTFRGMRWHMMQKFDRIYILDLHGNSKKNETAPDGSPDVNIFNIRQGVAILFGIKHSQKKQDEPIITAEVFHAEFQGSRESKYNHLRQTGWGDIAWTKLKPDPKHLLFRPIDQKLLKTYESGFNLAEFMPINHVALQSHRNGFALDMNRDAIKQRLDDMRDEQLSDNDFRKRHDLSDTNNWKVSSARARARTNLNLDEKIIPCDYRPFDRRYCMLDEVMMDHPRWSLLKNILLPDNFGLNFIRQTKSESWQHGLVSRFPTPSVFMEIKDGSSLALFQIQEDIDKTRRVNFKPELWKKFRSMASDENHEKPDEPAVFDYIYGVLYCPAYRKTFNEFLKIDFPRIPWPSTPAEFRDVSKKGNQLRHLHLMEPDAIGDTPYPFPIDGNGIVVKPEFNTGKVFINETQYFDNVPALAWNMMIGGYRPARRWLKDRKGRVLSNEETQHYKRIIKILVETDRIMKTISITVDI